MNLLLVFSFLFAGKIDLGTKPVWESNDNDYSTGGVMADIDNDGDLDLVTGNGNDMARDKNTVYYNNNKQLETTASWSSADSACNAHISLGDMDADGDLDLAVAGFALDGAWVSDPSRVYKNEAGRYSATPSWIHADTMQAFSCDWGDADGDGDLDLAIASGNDYIKRKQKVIIYENINFDLSANLMWKSTDSDYNMDVCWVDIDNDGDLDLAVGGYGTNRIYFAENGKLDTIAGWVSADKHHTVQIAFADFDNDGDMDMAAADNNQKADDTSKIRIYLNQNGTLDTLPFWESKLWRYQSCVAWGDADGDGDLDLAAGGWWEKACVYENKQGKFDTLPAWSWKPSNPQDIVCEQFIWTEINGDNWKEARENFQVSAGKVIYTSHFPLLDIIEVKINNQLASSQDYLWNPADGWIQFNQSGNAEIHYRYSQYPDLLLTNWQRNRGNFAFHNLLADSNSIAETHYDVADISLAKTLIPKGKAIELSFSIPNEELMTIALFDVSGRKLAEYNNLTVSKGLLKLDFNTSILSSGVYLIHIVRKTSSKTLRIQVI